MNLGPAVPRPCGRRPLMARLKVGVGLAVGLGLGLLAGPLPAAQAGTGVAGRAPSAPPLRIVDTSTFVPADGTFSFGVDTADLRLTDELAWTVHSLIPNTTEAIESALDGEPGPPLRSEQRATIAELGPVSYTHLRAHETVLDLVCRLLLEKKKDKKKKKKNNT